MSTDKPKFSLAPWILLSLLLGIGFGSLLFYSKGHWLHTFVGDRIDLILSQLRSLFLNLIKMIVAPLVLVSLILGLVTTSGKHVGRLLTKALLWFWLATAVALVMGLGAAHFLKPGLGAQQAASEKDSRELKEIIKRANSQPQKNLIEQIVPKSLVEALANNDLLAIVFFALLFGLALSSLSDEKKQPLIQVLQGINDAIFKMVHYIMYVAPLGVFAAISKTIATSGLGILWQLGKLVGALYIALVAFVIVLLIAVKLITKVNLKSLLHAIKEPFFIAFSSASSEPVLPKVIQAVQNLGVPPHIAGLVIPTGYSFNLDGTTLYLSLATMFIAQASGKFLPLSQQVIILLTLLVTSKGVAAVPRASLVVLAATCAKFDLPVEWVATILGVDAIMDMARTGVNVIGNSCAALVVTRWEESNAHAIKAVDPSP